MPSPSVPLLAAVLAAASVAAPAGAARERVATARYDSPSGVNGTIHTDVYVNGKRIGTATVHTRKGESRVRVRAVDDTGLPVLFGVGYDAEADGDVETMLGYWCGSTPGALRFKPTRGDVVVYIQAGTCGTGASAPTNGTVTAYVS